MEMLKITIAGCMAPAAALEFMARLSEQQSGKVTDPDFEEQYQRALNTFRRCVAKAIPLEPKYHKGIHGSAFDNYTCRCCGTRVYEFHKYCYKCGQRLTDAYLGRRKTKAEQKEFWGSETQEAIEELDCLYADKERGAENGE